MPCRYRHEGGYKNSKGAFLPKERGGSGKRIRGEEEEERGSRRRKGDGGRGETDRRRNEGTSSAARRRQASELPTPVLRRPRRGQRRGFGLGTGLKGGADFSRIGGCVRYRCDIRSACRRAEALAGCTRIIVELSGESTKATSLMRALATTAGAGLSRVPVWGGGGGGRGGAGSAVGGR